MAYSGSHNHIFGSVVSSHRTNCVRLSEFMFVCVIQIHHVCVIVFYQISQHHWQAGWGDRQPQPQQQLWEEEERCMIVKRKVKLRLDHSWSNPCGCQDHCNQGPSDFLNMFWIYEIAFVRSYLCDQCLWDCMCVIMFIVYHCRVIVFDYGQNYMWLSSIMCINVCPITGEIICVSDCRRDHVCIHPHTCVCVTFCWSVVCMCVCVHMMLCMNGCAYNIHVIQYFEPYSNLYIAQ